MYVSVICTGENIHHIKIHPILTVQPNIMVLRGSRNSVVITSFALGLDGVFLEEAL